MRTVSKSTFDSSHLNETLDRLINESTNVMPSKTDLGDLFYSYQSNAHREVAYKNDLNMMQKQIDSLVRHLVRIKL